MARAAGVVAQRVRLDGAFPAWLPNWRRKGTKIIAATRFRQYFRGKEGHIEDYIEGFKEFPPVE